MLAHQKCKAFTELDTYRLSLSSHQCVCSPLIKVNQMLFDVLLDISGYFGKLNCFRLQKRSKQGKKLHGAIKRRKLFQTFFLKGRQHRNVLVRQQYIPCIYFKNPLSTLYLCIKVIVHAIHYAVMIHICADDCRYRI